MANKTVRLFSGDLAGETGLTLELINPDTGAVGNGAGDSLTEVANGLFETTVTEAITGWWKAVVKKGAVTYASGGNLYIASDVVGEYLVDDFANNTAVANWSALTVDHTSTGSFGYVIGIFFSLIENVTGWRFTSKAVEQVAGPDVYVYPLAIGQEQRNTHQEITVYTSETGSQYFYAVDSDNTALDLTGLSLEFRVGDNKTKAILYTASTADATLTVTLTNKVTFTKSTKFTRFANSDVSYSLRNMSAGGEVLLDGPIRLKWAP